MTSYDDHVTGGHSPVSLMYFSLRDFRGRGSLLLLLDLTHIRAPLAGTNRQTDSALTGQSGSSTDFHSAFNILCNTHCSSVRPGRGSLSCGSPSGFDLYFVLGVEWVPHRKFFLALKDGLRTEDVCFLVLKL